MTRLRMGDQFYPETDPLRSSMMKGNMKRVLVLGKI
jgi:hypothetical protein